MTRFARDPYFAPRPVSLLAVPVFSRGSAASGVLLENRLIRGAFSAERLDSVSLIVGQLAVSLDNARLYSELSASRARIVTSADETRRRLTRDLHDGAQQSIVSAILLLKGAQDSHDAETTSGLVTDALERAESANTQLRDLAHGILPGALRHGGLRPAVSQLVSELPLQVNASVTGERFAAEIEANAYFVVAEAVTNVLKHSGARSVDVRAWVQDGVLQIEVSDDGVGGARREGSGLIGLADRVAAFEGSLVIDSPPDSGTRIAATLPLHNEDERQAFITAAADRDA